MNGDPSWAKLPDEQLVDRALNAEVMADRKAALAAIFAIHHRGVLALCSGLLQDPHLAADAAAETFAEAIEDLAKLNQPDNLRGWLSGIARNRCRQVWKRARREAPMPQGEYGDEDAEAYEKASRTRQAEVDRMLDTVAATFTAKQQLVFRLAIREGVAGAALATRLKVKPEEASRRTYEIITMAYQGFGALVLAKEGRRFCPKLAAILDRAAYTGDNFDKRLRQRIVRHLEVCLRCDNCGVCKTQRDRLVRPFAPALIPVLVLPTVKDRVDEIIKKRTRTRAERVLSGFGVVIVGILRLALTGALIFAAISGYQYLDRRSSGNGALPGFTRTGPTRPGPARPGPPMALNVWVLPGVGYQYRVRISPPGTDCVPVTASDHCNVRIAGGTTVRLTASLTGTDPFGSVKWLGCPSGTNAAQPCTFPLRQATSVCLVHTSSPWTAATCRSWATG